MIKGFRSSILSQFILNVIVFGVLLAIGAGIILMIERDMNHAYAEQRDELTYKRAIITQVQQHFQSFILRSRGYFAFSNPNELRLTHLEAEQLKDSLKAYSELKLNPEELLVREEFIVFVDDYIYRVLPTAIEYTQNGDQESLQQLSLSGTTQTVNRYIQHFYQTVESSNQQISALHARFLSQTDLSNNIMLGYIVIILILFVVMSRGILKKIIYPLQQLAQASDSLSQGHYDLKFDAKREDEIGILSKAFASMAVSIQAKEEELSAHNEELTIQQEELMSQQETLNKLLKEAEENQLTLDSLNQLNHALSITLNKQELLQKIVSHITSVYHFDKVLLMMLKPKGDYASAGISSTLAEQYVQHVEDGLLVMLEETKGPHVLKRHATPSEQGIAEEALPVYDIYLPIFSSEEELIAMLVAARIGREIEADEISSMMGIMNRISLAIERIKLYEETEYSRQLNRDIIDNVNEGIQLVGLNGELLQFNGQFCTILDCEQENMPFHLSFEEWTGYLKEKCLHHEELDIFLRESIFLTNQKSAAVHQYEIKQPAHRMIEVYAQSLMGDGRKIGTILVHRDITEEYKVDQMKSELVSTVSHELRTPLSSILGFTELILNKELKPERQKKYLETIYKEAGRLTHLINDFLDLQRMESGRLYYDKETVELNGLVNEVVEPFKVNQAKHDFKVSNTEGPLYIDADKSKIIQLLTNLISNAAKFSPEGGPITIRVEQNSGNALVHVSDQGLGIPQDEVPKLFQRFHRIDNSERRKIGGTGLGLAICKEIAAAHQGEISVDTELHKGSTFTFQIPSLHELTAESAAAIDREKDDGKETQPEEGHFASVVLLEDDENLALLIKDNLRENGFKVYHSTHADSAIQYIQQLQPEFVVIDLMIDESPEGWSVIESMKAHESTRHIPIIISSALDEKEKGKLLGANHYLTKPYATNALNSVIMQVLLDNSKKGEILFPESTED